MYEVVVGLFWIRAYEEQRLKPVVKRGLQVFRPIGRTLHYSIRNNSKVHPWEKRYANYNSQNKYLHKKISNSAPENNPLLIALIEQ